MAKNISIAVMAFLAGLLMTACDKNRVYTETHSVNEEGWPMDETLRYTIDVTDTQSVYNLFLDLRVCRNYRYANAFLFLTTTFPDHGMAADTLECPLALPDGRWRGKETRRYVDNRYYFKKHIIFPQAGTYTIDIAHGMRDTVIDGIKDIGLILERATQ